MKQIDERIAYLDMPDVMRHLGHLVSAWEAAVDVRYWVAKFRLCPHCMCDLDKLHPCANIIPHQQGRCTLPDIPPPTFWPYLL